MATLIIGPTCVGKTTFIRGGFAEEFGMEVTNVMMGARAFKREIRANTIIHYNLLHAADDQDGSGQEDIAIRPRDDPQLARILEAPELDDCFVLVAPRRELLRRIARRRYALTNKGAMKEHPANRYHRKKWLRVVARTRLLPLYEELFDILEARNLPYRVLFSSDSHKEKFLVSARRFVGQNLQNRYIPPAP